MTDRKDLVSEKELGIITCGRKNSFCTICNAEWISGDQCPNGHNLGQNYFVIEEGSSEKVRRKVRCEALANRCSICGGHFDEGNICTRKHILGEYY